MNCKVHGVFKNLRYRILIIDDEQYILDMGHSLWKLLFPFLFWMLPNPVFKVDDLNIVEKLKSSQVKQTKTGHSSVFGGAIGVFIATLLKPLQNYLAIPSTPLVNAVILMVVVVFVFILCTSINNMFKNKLQSLVNLRELSMHKLWVRPRSIKHFFQTVFFYLFSLALTLVFFMMSIEDPDVITLFFTMIVLLFLLFTGFLSITIGYTKVKFKGDKKTAV